MQIAANAAVSWKTTALGIIGGFMLLLPQLSAVLDDDPETNPDWQQVTAAFAMFGIGTVARDGDKSSQDVGVRR
ncbi:MAG: hypothetical protein AAGA55_02095 [Planctomycetota bacterium]